MDQPGGATRRHFIGGLVTAFGISKSAPLGFALQERRQIQEFADGVRTDVQVEYDRMVKLSSNENPYGPSEAVMRAMTGAWKYANRYGYPDGGITEAIAAHHKVTSDQVLLGSGSAEVLKAADDAFLPSHLKVVGVEPTFEVVYRFATNSRAEAITVPLREDHTVNMGEIIRITRLNARDVGLIYICNPNNPTGNVVHKDDIKLLFDSIPEDIPVLIDEAYHHFVDNPDYESSLKYVLEGRKAIITRTFSKIAALAGMRLGYGVAPKEVIDQMRRVIYGSINAVVKYGGVAALQDTAYEEKIKQLNSQVRERTTAQLRALGYEIIPSDANFFMVNVRRDVTPVLDEFRKRGILVGRKFPPMDTWLRVTVGSDEDMQRFVAAFKEIFAA
jgi:histidinol-phosphate aminotransferase